MLQLLAELKKNGIITPLNYHFARMIHEKQQPYGYTSLQQNLAVLLAALMSFHTQKGNSCLLLSGQSDKNLFDLNYAKSQREYLDAIMQKIERISPLAWAEALRGHCAFSENPEQIAPMLFQGERLYFYRYWLAENRLARYIKQAVTQPLNNLNTAQDRLIMQRLYPLQAPIDWQALAVAGALNRRFYVISGGPGTGKTHTVARLLAGLQLKQNALGLNALNIALAAPTGKAASRLKESIAKNLLDAKEGLISQFEPTSDEYQIILNNVPTVASTLHRLLGISPFSEKPKYHARNPLPYDLLVLDEASMIDLHLMEKLIEALDDKTRLILLGDENQLASVEAGAIMGELGALKGGYSQAQRDYFNAVTGYELPPQNVTPISDALCRLVHSRRFADYPHIGELAELVNEKKALESWECFARLAGLTHFAYESNPTAVIAQKAAEYYEAYLNLVQQRVADPYSVSVEKIFNAFQAVRFLSALRVGNLGVENLNEVVAQKLKQCGLVQFGQSSENYYGKPLLITENAAQYHIFSGDIGIILPDEQGQRRVYFDSLAEGGYLNISPNRLPAYEVGYVMTVHKSQGSEFDHTLLILPQQLSPVLCKELIYTAITRAKKAFSLFGDEAVWLKAVSKQIQRQSGLKAQLEA